MSSAGILLQDAACGFQTWKRTYIEAEKGELIMAVKLHSQEIQTAVKQHYLML